MDTFQDFIMEMTKKNLRKMAKPTPMADKDLARDHDQMAAHHAGMVVQHAKAAHESLLDNDKIGYDMHDSMADSHRLAVQEHHTASLFHKSGHKSAARQSQKANRMSRVADGRSTGKS